MKKSFVLSFLLLTATATALACGGWARPDYYVFSAFNRNQMGETFTQRTAQYWITYTDGKAEASDMNALGWANLENLEASDNPIIATAFKRNDRETIDYLRLLIDYLKQCNDVSDDNWSYPTKAQLANRNTRLKYINSRARTYDGTRYRPQYDLLVMRTLMLQGDTNGILSFWNSNGSRQSESVYKDMMRDIYAGALLRTGNKKEACKIYAELGDMQSIKFVMREQRNLNGIKKEYAEDPNSPTLVYLVQDFVNSSQSTYEALRGDYFEDIDVNAFRGNVAGFIDFAQTVVKQGKTKTPALWQSAAGFLTHLSGNSAQGVKMLEKAMTMDGTQRMKDNARMCRLIASIPAIDGSNRSLDFVNSELSWLKQTAKAEDSDPVTRNNYGNHYYEMIANVGYDYLPKKFRELGLNNLAAALIGWTEVVETETETETYYSQSDFYRAIDEMTADEMTDFSHYIATRQKSALENNLIAKLNLPDDYTNDRIGTKLIREGRFEEAEKILRNVPLSYIGTQAISSYMACRDYHIEQWFKRQRNHIGDDFNETPSPVKSNQKLDFCRDVINLKQKIAQNPENPQNRYELATILYQASYAGNCWYISRYANSVYDTICYRNEMDFLAEAVNQLEQAINSTNNNTALLQKMLYADAYIPFGEPYLTYVWDENYKEVPVVNRNCRRYHAMQNLNQFSLEHRGCESYITKCDILRKFRSL